MKNRWPVALVLLLVASWAAAQVSQDAPQAPLATSAGTQKLTEDLNDAIAKLRDLVRAHPDVIQNRRDDFALAKLGLEKTKILLQGYAEDEVRNKMAREALDPARMRLDLLATNAPFPADPAGLIEKAYLSQVDDSAQPYYLYRPAKLDPKKPVPLILFLHGYVGTIDKVTWKDMTFPDELTRLADQANAIVLFPFARSNTDFQGIGEQDVLDVIAKTLASTPADPDRVFLGGVSMGGSGVWTVASHNPDLFAGAFPIAGRTDYYLWKGLRKSDLPRFEQFLIDKEFSITCPQNFVNLPVRCYHTAQDILVSVDHSREMQKALLAIHAPIYYKEFAEGNHWGWGPMLSDDGLLAWILTTKLNHFPDTVRFKLLELRHNHAYWVTVDRIDKWGAPAEVVATRVNKSRIKVTATNVGQLTLRLDPKQMKLAPKIVVEINGKEYPIEPVAGAPATFPLTEAGKLVKRQDLCGPFYQLLEHRFVLVFPAKGDPDSVKRDRILCVKFLTDWQAFSTGVPRFLPDTDVTDADIASSNLILFGTPATNSFLARIADKLPVKFADGNYVIGKQLYSDKLGLIFVYPNPLNPDRLIAVCSGLHYGEHLSVNHKYDLIPDYIVFEDAPDPDATNWPRCAGFFDSNWRLDESLMETRAPAPPPPQPDLLPLVPDAAPVK